jgi:hypothetical protein
LRTSGVGAGGEDNGNDDGGGDEQFAADHGSISIKN